MENKSKLKALEHVASIETLVNTLATAKIHDFISSQEAKLIFTDILKEVGLKTAPNPMGKSELAHKKEEKK